MGMRIAQLYSNAPPNCLKCASDYISHSCPQTELEELKCANYGEDILAKSPTSKSAPRKNLQVIGQRHNVTYADAAKDASLITPSLNSPAISQNVVLATALRSLQQIIWWVIHVQYPHVHALDQLKKTKAECDQTKDEKTTFKQMITQMETGNASKNKSDNAIAEAEKARIKSCSGKCLFFLFVKFKYDFLVSFFYEI
nr:unnamed protein product [Callosobruchus chinensis]